MMTDGLPVNYEVASEARCEDLDTNGIPDMPYEVLPHALSYVLPKSPAKAVRPYAIEKEIGIAVNGVLLYGPMNAK
ncbi:MAG: hypothetical protein H6765_07805 [Candidatus Peribacteria bacterium]|nr:MAG: hypothetical protein H6765_07805 [Candidatus Peribacteria bacterium]